MRQRGRRSCNPPCEEAENCFSPIITAQGYNQNTVPLPEKRENIAKEKIKPHKNTNKQPEPTKPANAKKDAFRFYGNENDRAREDARDKTPHVVKFDDVNQKQEARYKVVLIVGKVTIGPDNTALKVGSELSAKEQIKFAGAGSVTLIETVNDNPNGATYTITEKGVFYDSGQSSYEEKMWNYIIDEFKRVNEEPKPRVV